MQDEILDNRLTFLEEHLERVTKAVDWNLAGKMLQGRGYNSDIIWSRVDNTIGREARLQQKAVEKARAELKAAKDDDDEHLRKAWQLYNQAFHRVEEILWEWLELIAGLALRDKNFDRRVCELADQLMKSCCPDTIGGAQEEYLTVPAPQSALGKTLFRMYRMRFPQWTVWDLPLMAYEFGYVICDYWEILPQFVSEQAGMWSVAESGDTVLEKRIRQAVAASVADTQREELSALLAEHLRGWRAGHPLQQGPIQTESTKERVRKLTADAFATYIMGPAYAYSAFWLRFDPFCADHEQPDTPSDAARAFLVLYMLERLNESEKKKPYIAAIKRLRDSWKRNVGLAGSTAELDPAEQEKLKKLADALWEFLEDQMRPTAKYPLSRGDEGWMTAQKFAEQLTDPENKLIAVFNTSKLRDVLNAAWIGRLELTERIADGSSEQKISRDLAELAENVKDLCEKIITKWKDSERIGGGGVGSPSNPATPELTKQAGG